MKKLFITTFFLVVFALVSPFSAQAACCKTVKYDAFLATTLKVSALGSQTECDDTCDSWFGLSSGFCESFYDPSATADIANNSCSTDVKNCCEISWLPIGSRTTLDRRAFYVISAGECLANCKLKTSCISTSTPSEIPNYSKHICEDPKATTAGTIASPTGPGTVDTGAGVNPLFQFSIPSDPLKYASYNPATVIAKVISVLLSILGTIALLMFIYAGFNWMTAMGNDAKINTAKKIMVWSTAGLVVIFISYIAAGFLLELVGVI